SGRAKLDALYDLLSIALEPAGIAGNGRIDTGDGRIALLGPEQCCGQGQALLEQVPLRADLVVMEARRICAFNEAGECVVIGTGDVRIREIRARRQMRNAERRIDTAILNRLVDDADFSAQREFRV